MVIIFENLGFEYLAAFDSKIGSGLLVSASSPFTQHCNVRVMNCHSFILPCVNQWTFHAYEYCYNNDEAAEACVQ